MWPQPLGQLPTDPLLPMAIAGQIRQVPGVAGVADGQWATVNVGEARIIVQGPADAAMLFHWAWSQTGFTGKRL